MSSVGTISRFYANCGTLAAVLEAVAQCCAELARIPAFARAGVLQNVLVLPHRAPPLARGVSFANLCGRVHHPVGVRAPELIYKPGVLPLLWRERTTFGSTAQLFTVGGNLCTCHNGQYTLVRGALSSASFAEVLRLAMQPAALARVTVHMLVAHARLGHHVDTGTDAVLEFLQTLFADISACTDMDEDSGRVKAVALREPRAVVTERFACPMLARAMLNIGQKGSVTVFYSFAPDTPFDELVDARLRALTEHLVAGVAEHT